MPDCLITPRQCIISGVCAKCRAPHFGKRSFGTATYSNRSNWTREHWCRWRVAGDAVSFKLYILLDLYNLVYCTLILAQHKWLHLYRKYNICFKNIVIINNKNILNNNNTNILNINRKNILNINPKNILTNNRKNILNTNRNNILNNYHKNIYILIAEEFDIWFAKDPSMLRRSA